MYSLPNHNFDLISNWLVESDSQVLRAFSRLINPATAITPKRQSRLDELSVNG